MSFSMAVLRAVNVTTLAFGLDEPDFAIAVPTLSLVFLWWIKLKLALGWVTWIKSLVIVAISITSQNSSNLTYTLGASSFTSSFVSSSFISESPSAMGFASNAGYSGYSGSFNSWEVVGCSGSFGFGETASATCSTSSLMGEFDSASCFSAVCCSLKHFEQRKLVF